MPPRRRPTQIRHKAARCGSPPTGLERLKHAGGGVSSHVCNCFLLPTNQMEEISQLKKELALAQATAAEKAAAASEVCDYAPRLASSGAAHNLVLCTWACPFLRSDPGSIAYPRTQKNEAASLRSELSSMNAELASIKEALELAQQQVSTAGCARGACVA